MKAGKKMLIVLLATFACSLNIFANLDLKAGTAYYIKYGTDKYLTLHVKKSGYTEYAAFTAQGSKFAITYIAEQEAYTIVSVEDGEYVGCDDLGFLDGCATPFYWVINGTNERMSIALVEPTDFGDLYLIDFGGPSIYGDSQDANWSIEEAGEIETSGISAVQITASKSRAYDLQGRAYTQPKTGLYIQNGHKALVK